MRLLSLVLWGPLVSNQRVGPRRPSQQQQHLEFDEVSSRRGFVAGSEGRLDRVLAEEFEDVSRSRWGEAIASGKVLVNGKEEKKSYVVSLGDAIEVAYEDDFLRSAPIPEDLPLEVVYEDDDVIVVNKAPGMVTHPAPGRPTGTLANALAYRNRKSDVYDQRDCRAGVVHRLDKGTSGVIVAAKTAFAQTALSNSFRDREVRKLYLAVCAGKVTEEGDVETLIARHPTKRDRMTAYDVDEPQQNIPGRPRYAKSTVRTLAADDQRSVVQVDIATGRTHQIRVHLAHLRAPVLGDDLYGDPRHNKLAAKPPFRVQRPLLHAWQLSFPHPTRNELMSFTAPPPDDFQRAISLVSLLA
mmetsp:Transcript_16825/g.54770  ORF Transcript_16825/g.54770 Transcript_16825/m.54770 type:complete len:355 (-) Transcript_16825:491-1555(-)